MHCLLNLCEMLQTAEELHFYPSCRIAKICLTHLVSLHFKHLSWFVLSVYASTRCSSFSSTVQKKKGMIPLEMIWVLIPQAVALIRQNLIYSSDLIPIHTVILCNERMCCIGDYKTIMLSRLLRRALLITGLNYLKLIYLLKPIRALNRCILLFFMTFLSFKLNCFLQPLLLP